MANRNIKGAVFGLLNKYQSLSISQLSKLMDDADQSAVYGAITVMVEDGDVLCIEDSYPKRYFTIGGRAKNKLMTGAKEKKQCPYCNLDNTKKKGVQDYRQRYQCKDCRKIWSVRIFAETN